MKRLVFAALSILLSVLMFGQDNNDLLKAVQAKYNSINTLSVDFSKSSGNKVDFSGKLYLKKENKLRIELTNNTIISDGETFWNYSKKENKVIINNYDADEPTELSLNSFINVYPSKSTVSEGMEDNYKTLTLKPKSSELDFSSAKLYINSDNLVEKVIIDSNSGKSTISFSDYMLNKDIQNSVFTYSPPKGIKVIDLR
ncbi:MAG TPA: outer membrane lipoprotein carrier protein LolA [Ignavibacteriaceae bacterium]